MAELESAQDENNLMLGAPAGERSSLSLEQAAQLVEQEFEQALALATPGEFPPACARLQGVIGALSALLTARPSHERRHGVAFFTTQSLLADLVEAFGGVGCVRETVSRAGARLRALGLGVLRGVATRLSGESARLIGSGRAYCGTLVWTGGEDSLPLAQLSSFSSRRRDFGRQILDCESPREAIRLGLDWARVAWGESPWRRLAHALCAALFSLQPERAHELLEEVLDQVAADQVAADQIDVQQVAATEIGADQLAAAALPAAASNALPDWVPSGNCRSRSALADPPAQPWPLLVSSPAHRPWDPTAFALEAWERCCDRVARAIAARPVSPV